MIFEAPKSWQSPAGSSAGVPRDDAILTANARGIADASQ
jgi:hypothetical protein